MVPNHQPVYTIHVKIFKYHHSGPATRDVHEVHEWLSDFCWIIWMWSQNLCQVSEVVRERTRYPMVHIHHQQKELTTSVVNLPITSSWRTGKSRQPAVFQGVPIPQKNSSNALEKICRMMKEGNLFTSKCFDFPSANPFTKNRPKGVWSCQLDQRLEKEPPHWTGIRRVKTGRAMTRDSSRRCTMFFTLEI